MDDSPISDGPMTKNSFANDMLSTPSWSTPTPLSSASTPLSSTPSSSSMDYDYWTRYILSQDRLKTAATLSLMIAVFNVLLQWIHFLKSGDGPIYLPNKLLLNAWYLLIMSLAIMTLRMASISSTHIATALAIYVAATMIFMLKIEGTGSRNDTDTRVCPFLATHASANVLATSLDISSRGFSNIDSSIRSEEVTDHSHNVGVGSSTGHTTKRPLWYDRFNLPIMPLFWLSLGGLLISIEPLLYHHSDERLLYQHSDELSELLPHYAGSRRDSSTTASYKTGSGSSSSKTARSHSSTPTIMGSNRTTRQLRVLDHAVIEAVQHDTLVIQHDLHKSLAAISAVVAHIRRHQQSNPNTTAKNSEPNIADALATCIANLSYVVTQFQPILKILDIEKIGLESSACSSATSQVTVVPGRTTPPVAQSSPTRTRVLFDPCDLTEQVADAVAFLADSKELELVVHTPVGGATEWYLTRDDPIVIRAILIKILSEILIKAEVNSHVTFNLHAELPTTNQRTSASPRTFTMNCTWQVVYTCSQTDPLEIEFCSKTTVFLQESGAAHHHTSDGDMCIEELRLDMEAIPLDNTFNAAIVLDQFVSPSEKKELWSFSKKLNGARFAIVTTRNSQFVMNLMQYLQNWGGQVTHGFASNWSSLRSTIDEFDSRVETAVTSNSPRNDATVTCIILIDDDLAVLDTLIKRRLEKRSLGCPIIYFAGLSNDKRVIEYQQAVMKQYRTALPSIHLISKPAGPRKLLQTLRHILFTVPALLLDQRDFPFTSLFSTSASAVAHATGIPQVPILDERDRVGRVVSASHHSNRSSSLQAREASIERAGRKYQNRKDNDVSSRAPSQTGSSNASTGRLPLPSGTRTVSGAPSNPMADVVPPGDAQNHMLALLPVDPGPSWRNVPQTIQSSSSTPSTSILGAPRINVLIVEDNIINQRILSTYLRHRGITNAVANNGQEAVNLWKAQKFHLVLMDIMMPIMDGVEATIEIRRLEQELRAKIHSNSSHEKEYVIPETVIVALTASSLPADRDRALGAGCNDYLVKPVTLVWLEKKIIEWGSMQALIEFASYDEVSEPSEDELSYHSDNGE